MMRRRRGNDVDKRVWRRQMAEQRGRRLPPWLRRAVLVGLVLVNAVVGYGVLNGWGDARLYGRGLLFAGAALIGFGLLTSIANARPTPDVEYLEVQAAMFDGGAGLAYGDLGDRIRRYGALPLFGCAALALVTTGLVLTARG